MSLLDYNFQQQQQQQEIDSYSTMMISSPVLETIKCPSSPPSSPPSKQRVYPITPSTPTSTSNNNCNNNNQIDSNSTTNSGGGGGNSTKLRPRASSTYFDDFLSEYVALKCKEKSTRKDFDETTMDSLRQLPLFQAIQVVHRFNDSVGPRVVNRQAFLVSIIRSTSRWWNAVNNKSKEILLVEDGPNTALIVQLCMTSSLNPDVFTPSVCHALQLLTPEQVNSVAQAFGSNAIALHVADDSYYAKQQLFLSMAHAALMNFPSFSASNTNESPMIAPEATATEAAELGRKRADASAAAQLPGILTEFIARTCASSNRKIKESDLDTAARDALKRVALIQAMQAMQHFSVSIESDQVQKKSAYLMGILRGQEQHWERSRASRNCEGGAKELLNLHPRLLLKIAHLCLDGNLLPSDFSPEVCFEFKDLDCDSAIKSVVMFNSNKRISAGEHGGVKNRIGFFLGLLKNFKQEMGVTTTTANNNNNNNNSPPSGGSTMSSMMMNNNNNNNEANTSFVLPSSLSSTTTNGNGTSKNTGSSTAGSGFVVQSELNAAAKPFTPTTTTTSATTTSNGSTTTAISLMLDNNNNNVVNTNCGIDQSTTTTTSEGNSMQYHSLGHHLHVKAGNTLDGKSIMMSASTSSPNSSMKYDEQGQTTSNSPERHSPSSVLSYSNLDGGLQQQQVGTMTTNGPSLSSNARPFSPMMLSQGTSGSLSTANGGGLVLIGGGLSNNESNSPQQIQPGGSGLITGGFSSPTANHQPQQSPFVLVGSTNNVMSSSSGTTLLGGALSVPSPSQLLSQAQSQQQAAQQPASPMMLPGASLTVGASTTGSLVEGMQATLIHEKRINELTRLLESSRDAIAFLTSALARSRANELRLRRELQDTQNQLHSVVQTMRIQRENVSVQIDQVRNQAMMNLTRSFEGLNQAMMAAMNQTLQQQQQEGGSNSNPNNNNNNNNGGNNNVVGLNDNSMDDGTTK